MAEPEDLTVLDSKELPEEEKTIWKTYVDEATKQDKENITNWNQSIDVLLVFVRPFLSCDSLPSLITCNLLGGFIFGNLDRIHHRVLQTHAAESTADCRGLALKYHTYSSECHWHLRPTSGIAIKCSRH